MNGGSASDGFGLSGQGPFSVWDYRGGANKIGLGVATIPDGSSNTVLVGEILCGVDQNDVRGVWAAGSIGSSLIGGHAIGDDRQPNDPKRLLRRHLAGPEPPTQNLGNWTSCTSNQATARSRHPGGVNILLGDGSVRFVRTSITQQNWYMINSANDGQPTPNF